MSREGPKSLLGKRGDYIYLAIVQQLVVSGGCHVRYISYHMYISLLQLLWVVCVVHTSDGFLAEIDDGQGSDGNMEA
jgi:hypothetical protein